MLRGRTGAEKFRDLYIATCQDVGIEPAPSVLEQLRHSPEAITKLDLSAHHLQSKASYAIAEALKEDTMFHTVDLWDCVLGDEGCINICKALKHNQTVKTLDFRGNNIKVEGAYAIAEMLRVNTVMLRLGLQWNSIGLWDVGVKGIAEALIQNTTLTDLDLRNNRIGPQGAVALAHAIRKNSTLKRLDLRWNNIGLTGGQALAEAMKYNYTISVLDVAGNDIPDEVVAAIESAVMRNKDNVDIRENFQNKSRALEGQLDKQRRQTDSLMMSFSSQFENITTEHKQNETALQAQLSELTSKLVEERRSLAETLTKKDEEARMRAVAEMRFEDAQITINRLKEDYTDIVEKLQAELILERQVKTEIEKGHQRTVADSRSKYGELEGTLKEVERTNDQLLHELTKTRDIVQQEKRRTKALEERLQLEKDERKKIEEDSQLLHESVLNQSRRESDQRVQNLETKLRQIEAHRREAEEEVERKRIEVIQEKATATQKLRELESSMREDERKTMRVLEERLHAMQVARDELKQLSDLQSREIKELQHFQEVHIRLHENEVRKERDDRAQLQRELIKLQAEYEVLKADRDQLSSHLRKSQASEAESKQETEKLKMRTKSQEETLDQRERELRALKLDEERRIQALEAAMSTYVKMTFSEARRPAV